MSRYLSVKIGDVELMGANISGAPGLINVSVIMEYDEKSMAVVEALNNMRGLKVPASDGVFSKEVIVGDAQWKVNFRVIQIDVDLFDVHPARNVRVTFNGVDLNKYKPDHVTEIRSKDPDGD